MLRTCRSFTGNERDLLSQEMYASEDSTYRDDVNFELCLLTMQRKRQHYVLHCKSNKCVGTELEDVMQKGRLGKKACPCLRIMDQLWEIFHLPNLEGLRGGSTSHHASICAARRGSVAVRLCSARPIKVAPSGHCNLPWLHCCFLPVCRAWLRNEPQWRCAWDIHLNPDIPKPPSALLPIAAMLNTGTKPKG